MKKKNHRHMGAIINYKFLLGFSASSTRKYVCSTIFYTHEIRIHEMPRKSTMSVRDSKHGELMPINEKYLCGSTE